MLLALPFPNFDPVLIQLGPFAIRWYALAYIVGILLGWLYARAIIRTEQLWGGPAPMTATDFDDFIVWVTLGIILGGRIGYVAVLQPGLLRRASARSARAVEGRHVVPRRLHRLRRWPWCCSRKKPRHSGAVARRRDLRGRADRAVPRAARELHQRRIVGPAGRCALGHGVSDRRAAAAPSEPALRGDAGRPRAVRRARAADPRAAR